MFHGMPLEDLLVNLQSFHDTKPKEFRDFKQHPEKMSETSGKTFHRNEGGCRDGCTVRKIGATRDTPTCCHIGRIMKTYLTPSLHLQALGLGTFS